MKYILAAYQSLGVAMFFSVLGFHIVSFGNNCMDVIIYNVIMHHRVKNEGKTKCFSNIKHSEAVILKKKIKKNLAPSEQKVASSNPGLILTHYQAHK